jgi:hypothetical protein
MQDHLQQSPQDKQQEDHGKGLKQQEQEQKRVRHKCYSDVKCLGLDFEADEVLLSDGEEGCDEFVVDQEEVGKWFKGVQGTLQDVTNLPQDTPADSDLKGQGRQQRDIRGVRLHQQQQQEDHLAGSKQKGITLGDGGSELWDEDLGMDDLQQLDEAEWGEEGAQQPQERGLAPAATPSNKAQDQLQHLPQQQQQRSLQSGLDAVLQTTFAKKPPAVPGAGGSRLQRNSNSYALKMLKEHKEQEQRLEQLEQAAQAKAAAPRAVLPPQLQHPRHQQPKENRQQQQQQKPLGRSLLVNLCEEDVISDSQGDSEVMEITPLPGPGGAARAGGLTSAHHQHHHEQQQQLPGSRRMSGLAATSAARPGVIPEGAVGHQAQLSLRTSLLQTPGPTAALNFSRVDQQQQQQQQQMVLQQSDGLAAAGSMAGWDGHCGSMGGGGQEVGQGAHFVPAGAAAEHKPPWWDILPDFVPVEVLAERGIDPR